MRASLDTRSAKYSGLPPKGRGESDGSQVSTGGQRVGVVRGYRHRFVQRGWSRRVIGSNVVMRQGPPENASSRLGAKGGKLAQPDGSVA